MYFEKHGSGGTVTPRIVIHGGAGNIVRHGFPVNKYEQYRTALLRIITSTHAYMMTTISDPKDKNGPRSTPGPRRPSALEVATHAVVQLEDNPLFNSGHGAVFTRDGTNELEASVMVSRGFKKRGVGVMGLRHVRNPVLLARAMLEHGEQDLGGGGIGRHESQPSALVGSSSLDAPSAQGPHAALRRGGCGRAELPSSRGSAGTSTCAHWKRSARGGRRAVRGRRTSISRRARAAPSPWTSTALCARRRAPAA
ncbi:Isoaspartyl peptidase [Beauveria bassiana D1-5]|uniref:Isoaspartyl peptidase n=1 Tax=Beauveria bassiana D1-5 TaxID=1245745 RepID=A0A0A2VX24_BEABA|nr:Isoaspartyl peptidase [Beauveria bassiana D1-5]